MFVLENKQTQGVPGMMCVQHVGHVGRSAPYYRRTSFETVPRKITRQKFGDRPQITTSSFPMSYFSVPACMYVIQIGAQIKNIISIALAHVFECREAFA